jgi:hypothetical protein
MMEVPMWNKPRITNSLPQTRLLQGAVTVAIVTLATGLPLGGSAMADEPFQVVAVSGQVACSDYTIPEGLEGSSERISGVGPHFVNFGPGLLSEVRIDLFGDTSLDFQVSAGPDLVDVFVVKGSADAQQYAYLDASFGEGLTTARIQRIQEVTVCGDGQDTEFPNLPLPACNVGDNRDGEENECTAEDAAINAIIFKYATIPAGDVEAGQSFFCQCGTANVQTQEGPLDISGLTELDELDSIGIVSLNPTCFSWSIVGGKKTCVIP